jgi:hypothetical protein
VKRTRKKSVFVRLTRDEMRAAAAALKKAATLISFRRMQKERKKERKCRN